ncbi:MAG: peptidase [Pseudomonadota bacterium]
MPLYAAMTYCLAIRVDAGLVFCSDSRTNAGVDHISTYSKMRVFEQPGERTLVLLSAGNLATTQAVANRLQRDIDDPRAKVDLHSIDYMFDAAEYVGQISRRAQSLGGAAQGRVNLSASFILGGQIKGQPPRIYMIYPEGNYIQASESQPFLQIGETKYGKPILDRMAQAELTLDAAARLALVSMDSTRRSNVSVGPPFEVAIYPAGALKLERHLSLDREDPYFARLQDAWGDALEKSFSALPAFDWE